MEEPVHVFEAQGDIELLGVKLLRGDRIGVTKSGRLLYMLHRPPNHGAILWAETRGQLRYLTSDLPLLELSRAVGMDLSPPSPAASQAAAHRLTLLE